MRTIYTGRPAGGALALPGTSRLSLALDPPSARKARKPAALDGGPDRVRAATASDDAPVPAGTRGRGVYFFDSDAKDALTRSLVADGDVVTAESGTGAAMFPHPSGDHHSGWQRLVASRSGEQHNPALGASAAEVMGASIALTRRDQLREFEAACEAAGGLRVLKESIVEGASPSIEDFCAFCESRLGVTANLAATVSRCVTDRDLLPVNVVKLIAILKVALANDAVAEDHAMHTPATIEDVRAPFYTEGVTCDPAGASAAGAQSLTALPWEQCA